MRSRWPFEGVTLIFAEGENVGSSSLFQGSEDRRRYLVIRNNLADCVPSTLLALYDCPLRASALAEPGERVDIYMKARILFFWMFTTEVA